MRKLTLSVALIIVLLGVSTTAQAKPKSTASGDPEVLKLMYGINEQLAEMGLNLALEEIEFFTVGRGRSPNRIHQQEFRWVAYDPIRLAQGKDITYLVDQSEGDTLSGLSNAETEAAIDSAMSTWNNLHAMRKVEIVKRTDTGVDPDIFDWFFGFGDYGNPHLADIVHAGWLPHDYFEAVGGPGGGRGILAFSVTFIWVDDITGEPTDMNGDNYLDTALNEVYFNDYFGEPGGSREGYPWGIDVQWPAIDVETVALHESGHSLGIGHFGPPPVAVMNPVYGGIMQSPYAIDIAGMNIVWASWPK